MASNEYGWQNAPNTIRATMQARVMPLSDLESQKNSMLRIVGTNVQTRFHIQIHKSINKYTHFTFDMNFEQTLNISSSLVSIKN